MVMKEAEGGAAGKEELIRCFLAKDDDGAPLGDVVGVDVAALGEGEVADFVLDVGLRRPRRCRSKLANSLVCLRSPRCEGRR